MKIKNYFLVLISNIFIITSLNAQSTALEWVNQIGWDYSDQGRSIAIDSIGNSYITGYFRGTIDFDPGLGSTFLTSNGFSDIFIQKLDTGGNLVWVKQMGGSGRDESYSITLDKSGNIYSTGYFYNIVDFDPNSGVTNLTTMGSGSLNAYIQKLDSRGNLLWVKQLGGNKSVWGLSLKNDLSDNLLITGIFYDTLKIDTDSGDTNLITNGNSDVFILKINNSGDLLWLKQMGGIKNDVSLSINSDKYGNVYTTGYFSDTVDFDPGLGITNQSSNGFSDIFIQKLDSNGNLLWVKQMGSIFNDYGQSITLDSEGYLYITGFFQREVDFDPGTGINNLNSLGEKDVFIQKLDKNGNLLWVKQIGGIDDDEGQSIVTDARGNIYISGYFSETLKIYSRNDTIQLSSKRYKDIFILKLNNKGDFSWIKQMGGTSNEEGLSIVIDDRFNIYLTGYFQRLVDFDPESTIANLSSAGGTEDAFIMKLSQCEVSFTTDTITACKSYTWIDNIIYNTSNDSASFTLTNTAGCDSIITLNLNIDSLPSTATTVNEFEITADNPNGSYQWLDCEKNYIALIGDTNQTFKAKKNGSYAVKITENNCVDTSECIAIVVGLDKIKSSKNLVILPNPTTGQFGLVFNETIKVIDVSIYTIHGKLIQHSKHTNSKRIDLKIEGQSNGIYFVDITTGLWRETLKVFKEK